MLTDDEKRKVCETWQRAVNGTRIDWVPDVPDCETDRQKIGRWLRDPQEAEEGYQLVENRISAGNAKDVDDWIAQIEAFLQSAPNTPLTAEQLHKGWPEEQAMLDLIDEWVEAVKIKGRRYEFDDFLEERERNASPQSNAGQNKLAP